MKNEKKDKKFIFFFFKSPIVQERIIRYMNVKCKLHTLYKIANSIYKYCKSIMIASLWIIGVGPVLYDNHPRLLLNDTVLPNNVYDSVRLLYNTCGRHYYRYTKYINQTMGNVIIKHLKTIYPKKHTIALTHSYKVNTYYKPCSKYIDSTLDVKILNTDLSYDHIRLPSELSRLEIDFFYFEDETRGNF